MFFNDVFSNLDDMKENTSCFVCQKHIDLVQRSIKCRCKQVFCDAHRYVSFRNSAIHATCSWYSLPRWHECNNVKLC